MARWGLNGMQSFAQPGVAQKEGERLQTISETPKEVDASLA